MVANLKNTQDVAIRNPITGEYAETGGPTDPVNTTLLVEDANSSDIIPLSGISDENGKYYLQVVDGAPAAYDETENALSVIGSHKVIKIVDNVVISSTTTPTDINFSKFNNFAITYHLGAASSGSPTLVISVKVKDANGNLITDTDYTTSTLAPSASGIIKGVLEGYGTIQVLATLGGSGGFAASTVAIEMK